MVEETGERVLVRARAKTDNRNNISDTVNDGRRGGRRRQSAL